MNKTPRQQNAESSAVRFRTFRHVPILATGHWLLATFLFLTACDNFTPTPKTARYDTRTGGVTMPAPCPDWSQSQVHNYLNEHHSNFGCAVNSNSAVQLAYPQDLLQGHGTDSPDTATTVRVIERYRAGEIPTELTPVQTTGAPQ